jgi:hypothetical protein
MDRNPTNEPRGRVTQAEKAEPMPHDITDARLKPIVLECFPVPIARAIAAEGVKTYGELAAMPFGRLLLHKAVGRSGLKTIEVQLLKMGLQASGSPTPMHTPLPSGVVSGHGGPGVYFFTCCEWVKIGWATNVRRRVESLTNANPFQTNLEAVLRSVSPREARDLEKHFHDRFQRLRHRNEWFQNDPEIWAAVREHQGREVWQ